MMQTEYEFTLPRGYVDDWGQVHAHGRMRVATALDEIEAVNHPLVQANESYLPVMLLGRVITQLGTLPGVTQQVIEKLFAADLIYLQDLYLRINSAEAIALSTTCPHCSGHFQVQVAPLG